ncbi:MAG: VPLPA-CTERM sorting domain-containing protein [Pseudomonadota bacterium]
MAPDSAVDFNDGVAGNVLILQETGSDVPDDQAPGGTIVFSSALSNPAFFLNSFWAIDDGLFTIMAGGESASVNNGSGPSAENVEGQAVFSTPVLINPGESFTLTFSGSGAIDNLSISEVPVPPAALLLLGALGGFAVIRRKRRGDA